MLSEDKLENSKIYEYLFKSLVKRKNNKTYKIELLQIYKKYLHKSIGNKSILTIKSSHINTIIKKIEHLSPSRQHKILGIASQVFSEAIESGDIQRSPILKRYKVKIDRAEQKFIVKEAHAVFKEVTHYLLEVEDNPLFKVMGFMLVEQARRKNEIYQMKWGDINFKMESCLIPAKTSKNRRGFTFKLSLHTLTALKELYEYNTSSIKAPKSTDYVLRYKNKVHISSFDYEFKKLKSKMIDYFEKEKNDNIAILVKSYSPHRYRNLFSTYYYNVVKIEQSAIALALNHANEKQIEQYITYYDTHIVGDFV